MKYAAGTQVTVSPHYDMGPEHGARLDDAPLADTAPGPHGDVIGQACSGVDLSRRIYACDRRPRWMQQREDLRQRQVGVLDHQQILRQGSDFGRHQQDAGTAVPRCLEVGAVGEERKLALGGLIERRNTLDLPSGIALDPTANELGELAQPIGQLPSPSLGPAAPWVLESKRCRISSVMSAVSCAKTRPLSNLLKIIV